MAPKPVLSPSTDSSPAERAARVLLFVFVSLVACPIRYWPVTPGLDETWIFALNYAAAHGLSTGRDVVWTTGPLAYLVFPQDIGDNLLKALAFQSAIWAVMIAIFHDLFFFTGAQLRNLAVFSFFFVLAAPLFWFNYIGVENLLVAGVLILLALVRVRGGRDRYLAALLLIGITPLIKLTGGLIVAGALGGLWLQQVIRIRWKAVPQLAFGLTVPLAAAAVVSWLTIPSLSSVGKYLSASRDIAGEFSAAMSATGRPSEYLMAAAILILAGALLALLAIDQGKLAGFFVLLLAVPAAISVKHGFVRQDVHLVNFVSFAALAMGLIALQISWNSRFRQTLGAGILLTFLALWGCFVAPYFDSKVLAAEVTGLRSLYFGGNALFRWNTVRAKLRAWSEREMQQYPAAHLEPEIRALIGDAPVASMSISYSGLYLENADLRIYPVVQRYSAYTPLLDGLNAAWIKRQGPRFLVFDGDTIDHRDAWAETPAMWLEVYRWYDTRLLGARNLLLERRATPRFQSLESIGRTSASLAAGLRFPASSTPVFWTMSCSMNVGGKLRKVLFRLPEVDAVEQTRTGPRPPRRVLMSVLTSPVMGNHLPGSLQDFAAVFDGRPLEHEVEAITFPAGAAAYSEPCEVEFLRPRSLIDSAAPAIAAGSRPTPPRD